MQSVSEWQQRDGQWNFCYIPEILMSRKWLKTAHEELRQLMRQRAGNS